MASLKIFLGSAVIFRFFVIGCSGVVVWWVVGGFCVDVWWDGGLGLMSF